MTDQKAQHRAAGAQTNSTKDSLVKVVIQEDSGKWKCPEAGEVFYIDEDANFPKIDFEVETESAQDLEWSYMLSWPAAVCGLREGKKRGKVLKTFSEGKSFRQDSARWTFDPGGQCVGGRLTVKVKIGTDLFTRSIQILGKNPGRDRILEHLSILDAKGLDELFEKESGFKNFLDSDGQPIVSFDGGYGLAQMTMPAPSYVQVWNWKENVKAAIELFKEKHTEAKRYLSAGGKAFTEEQLQLEILSRWNGGKYHKWDAKKKMWIRDPEILSDTATGNIAWNMTLKENKGKTEAELHERDKDEYKNPPAKVDRLWHYSGITYADHIKK